MHSKNYAIVGIQGSGRNAQRRAIVVENQTRGGKTPHLIVKESNKIELIEGYPVSKDEFKIMEPFYKTFFPKYKWVLEKIK